MAKESKPPKTTAETAFQRFQRLARRIVAVPKEKAQARENDSPQSQS